MVDDMPFLIIFVALYAVFTAIRIYYRSRPTVRERSEQRREGIDRFGGPAGIAVSISVLGYWASIALYVVSPPWMSWSVLALPAWARWAGVLVGIVCLPFLVWIHRTMGRYYLDRLELRDDHELITSGPFSRIRNPMYLVLLTYAAAMGLVTSYLLNILFSLITIASMNWLVSQEEEMMLERFGDEYRTYMKRTGRFLPRLGREADTE
jgi:protein-S-isoprenylcysteine O-methyltransferase Ste14